MFPPSVVSDNEGRYRVAIVSGGPVKVIAEKTGYSQPCRVAVAGMSDSTADVYLVSDALLSTTGIPASMPVTPPTLSGLVFEQTGSGLRPVMGADVIADFTGGMGWAPSATTKSDAMGRYLLCAVAGSPLGVSLFVTKAGYRDVYVPINLPGTTDFDVELARR